MREPMAHRVEPSACYRLAEFAVYVGGIGVLLYLLFVWLPS